MKKCGFYEYVEGAEFHVSDRTGSIRFRRCYKVESPTARELRDFAAKRLFGHLLDEIWFKPKLGAIQRTLIECMSNTFGHAAGSTEPIEDIKSESIPWWASVMCDVENNIASFTFVDNGVGILKSGNVQLYLRMLEKVGLIDNTELLRRAIHGEIPSRTKRKERGEGLPGMRIDAVERRLIHNLMIISNDVRADISLSSYKKLKNAFDGTIVYWELNGEEP